MKAIIFYSILIIVFCVLFKCALTPNVRQYKGLFDTRVETINEQIKKIGG